MTAARAEQQSLKDSKDGNELAADGRTKLVVAREKVTKLQAELAAFNDPALRGPVAFGVRDAKIVNDT